MSNLPSFNGDHNALMQFIGGYLTTAQTQENTNKLIGNVLMSGVPNEGQAVFIKNLLLQSLMENKSIVIFTNKDSLLNNSLTTFQQEMKGQKKIWNLDFSNFSKSDTINPFSNLAVTEIKDLIIDILKQQRPMNETESINIGRYVNMIIKALMSSNQSIKLNELIDYGDHRVAANLIMESGLPEGERQRTQRFIKSFEFVVLYETYFDLINEKGLGDIFSGEENIEDILNSGNILVITVEQSINKESSEATIQLLMKLLLKNFSNRKIDDGALFVFDGIRMQNMDLFNNILQLNQTNNVSSVFTVEDVSEQIKLSGNQFIDKCKTFAIFTQSSNANCQYWSDFCGYHESTQVSWGYSPSSNETGKGKGGFGSQGVVERQEYRATNMGTSKQLKPIYRPEVFRGLKDKELILFSKSVNKKRKINL
ncbi:hypothetical protein [Cytobacillus oceanisediminis]|uniref:hypothetical protein n=1 Tax=Cytobacillus oceanisediminis TaxID=665099 RepID=UPI001FB1F538|nr:hypothetical protein [Cytobacillus oceanisediminis]UOE53486.1 hypothetical protein IRB79_16550 [Cytobacillus oceanisediminis]